MHDNNAHIRSLIHGPLATVRPIERELRQMPQGFVLKDRDGDSKGLGENGRKFETFPSLVGPYVNSFKTELPTDFTSITCLLLVGRRV